MPIAVRIWILLSTLLVCAGWILSGLHWLNRAGYFVFFALAAVAAVCWWRKKQWQPRQNPAQAWHKFKQRFKRPAPFLFFVLFGLALLGGILYPPVPGDASMYRTPRVLHWLTAEQWHWIRTFDNRMNWVNCGFEWLTAPLILFTRTDRLFFLINLISYALLPGLVFSVFRRLQVPGQVAWWWMWLLPAAFCYALQAGTLANDSMAGVYALASVAFALQARTSRQVNDLWFSMLAMALAAGVKQTNLPLALLWLIGALPAFRLLLKNPFGTAAVVLLSLLVSGLPTMCLNLLHDCNWAGIPNHPGPDWTTWKNVRPASSFWSIVGNLISVPVQNFAPPFFPCYQGWNGWMQRFVQTPWGSHFSSFEHFCKLAPYLTEQTAGLGFAVVFLLLISMVWTWKWRRKNNLARAARPFDWQIFLWRLAPWFLLGLFMAELTSYESARYLSPYYPFLLPAILAPAGMSMLARQVWWQRLSLLAMVTTATLLVLTPLRPLWPANAFFNHLAQRHPGSAIIARAQSFYSTSEINQLARHVFQSTLPPDEPVVGYATDIRGLEPGLWRPFTRRVERVLPGDARGELLKRGVRCVVVDDSFLKLTGGNIEQLLAQYDARMIDKLAFPTGFGRLPEYVYLIQLQGRTNEE